MDRATRDERTQTEELGELVGDLYEATLDRMRWPNVLMRVAKFVGGPAADLLFADVTVRSGMAHFDESLDGADNKIGLDDGKHVAAGPNGFPAEPGRSLELTDFSRKIVETGSRADWKPAQFLFNLSALLDMSAAAGVLCAHDSLPSKEAFERMQMIAPHLRRAIRIARQVESRDEMSATFACAFDGLDAAVFLIDSGGSMLHANAAAHAIIAAGEVLRVGASDRLAACGTAAADRDFQNVLAAACRGAAMPDAAVPLTGRDGLRFVAHVLPLKSAARECSGIYGAAAAAVFVRRVLVPVSSASEAIGKAFRLTPAEQRVLTAIVELGGVPTVAPALGLSEATVKTHLIHIFKKTGAPRQQDLVKLVARYLTPLAR